MRGVSEYFGRKVVGGTLLLLLAGMLGGGAQGLTLSPVSNVTGRSGSATAGLAPAVQEFLATARPTDSVRVIVRTEGTPDLLAIRASGVRLRRVYPRIRGAAGAVSAAAIPLLARVPGVVHISLDDAIAPFNDLTAATVGAVSARSSFGLDGNGVTVAVLDSGVAPHPDLGSRLVAEAGIVGGSGFGDPFGHGTHVAGIVAGDGSAGVSEGGSVRYAGIAPKAKIVSVRVLGSDGSGWTSDVIAGIEWVLQNRDRYAIRVLNVSLGHPVRESYLTDPLAEAVRRAWEAGIVVVASAGNNGSMGFGTINSPGNSPIVLTVGATNNYATPLRMDDILTTFSSRGPTPIDHFVKPDLVAPGNRTISLRVPGSWLDSAYPTLRVKKGAYLSDPLKALDDSPYFQLSGTSMATPAVSGMAALMLQANPSLSPDTIKLRLMRAAEKRLEYDIFTAGAGFAELLGALADGTLAVSASLSPAAIWTETGLLLDDAGGLLGDAVFYGSDPLRGTGALWGDAAVWGDGTVWGDGATWGDAAVWGDGAVWGDQRPPLR
jgi:serine protease AprX